MTLSGDFLTMPVERQKFSQSPADPLFKRLSEHCRRRGSNPHSRREHDFESCASASSATPAEVSERGALPGAQWGSLQCLGMSAMAELELCGARGACPGVPSATGANAFAHGRTNEGRRRIVRVRRTTQAVAGSRPLWRSPSVSKASVADCDWAAASSLVVNFTLTSLLMPCSSMVTP